MGVDPISIAIIGTSILGLGAQAYGMQQQQAASDSETRALIKANQREAELLEDQAEQVGEEGVQAEYDIIQEGEQFIGVQRAGASGTGVVVDSGTNADLLAESQSMIDADVATSRETYAKERKRLLEAATYTRENAATIKQQGQYRSQGIAYAGAGRLLGSGATLAGRWYNYQNTGTW